MSTQVPLSKRKSKFAHITNYVEKICHAEQKIHKGGFHFIVYLFPCALLFHLVMSTSSSKPCSSPWAEVARALGPVQLTANHGWYSAMEWRKRTGVMGMFQRSSINLVPWQSIAKATDEVRSQIYNQVTGLDPDGGEVLRQKMLLEIESLRRRADDLQPSDDVSSFKEDYCKTFWPKVVAIAGFYRRHELPDAAVWQRAVEICGEFSGPVPETRE